MLHKIGSTMEGAKSNCWVRKGSTWTKTSKVPRGHCPYHPCLGPSVVVHMESQTLILWISQISTSTVNVNVNVNVMVVSKHMLDEHFLVI